MLCLQCNSCWVYTLKHMMGIEIEIFFIIYTVLEFLLLLHNSMLQIISFVCSSTCWEHKYVLNKHATTTCYVLLSNSIRVVYPIYCYILLLLLCNIP
ncbi:hypothetical protein EB796_020323 [Bugula neritina]|uniref:Uncharacterized protein n=1 Tax=Bugula neritina TaxID=10212 RepID=A0A7J7J642_BUGNE|nr:hypothetical protein EB796_020323 [Bugula neritina]